MISNDVNAAKNSGKALVSGLRFVGIASAVLMMSACGSKLVRNADAERVQRDLVELRADRNLATQSPMSMQEAEKAVQTALVPERDKALSAHRVYIADRKVQTARSLAQAQFAVEQRKTLSEQSDKIRLDARTREANAAKREANARTQEAILATSDANAARSQASMAMSEANQARLEAEARGLEAGNARNDAEMARGEAELSKSDADMARGEAELSKSDADMARIDAEIARKNAERSLAEANLAKSETNAALDAADEATRKNDALMLQLADLQAKKTERGVQLTLGDVLFSTGRADLKSGSAAKLDQLVKALASVPERNILIEGFTDNVGTDAMNQVLSQNRANTVSNYLSSQGVPSARITATGKGESLPVAGNEIPAGRQLNRRVEVTIENPID